VVVVLGLAGPAARAADGKEPCKEGFTTATGYPAGLLFRKLGYDQLYTTKAPAEGEESDALAEARKLEELLFPASPGVDKLYKIIHVISGIFSGTKGPDPMTVDNQDLLWLNSLKRPDIPLQWRGKVITYLLSFKKEKRWQNILRTWFKKRGLYGPMIRTELRCRDMPVDLEFVAMIESGYRADAKSPAGATGLWQFMPGTGKAYGLVQTSWMDQRRSPEMSTVAALTHLADLKARLGSWYLALASYNAGYGNILKAVKKFNSNDFWTLSETEGALPWETTNYVPKIIAVAVASKNPSEFGLEDVQADPALTYRVVQVPHPVKLVQLAKSAGITLDEVMSLNPELKKNRVPPDVLPYPVRIPDGVDPVEFDKSFKKVCDGFKPVIQYEVRFGDTLSAIAKAAKTSVKELEELNEIDPEEKLLAGTHILVPKAPKEDKGSSAQKKEIVVVPHVEKPPKGMKRIFYTVIEGDTLSEIAQFFGVGLTDLCLWNALDPEAVIVPGMVVQMFVEKGFDVKRAVILDENEVKILVSGSQEHIEYLLEEQGLVRAEYEAREGESIKQIAKKFKVKVSSLQSINNLPSSTVFKGGETVILYVKPSLYKKHFEQPEPGPDESGQEAPPQPESEAEPGETGEPVETGEPGSGGETDAGAETSPDAPAQDTVDGPPPGDG
jgi:membrane-bound lytic murein transglycosylase D